MYHCKFILLTHYYSFISFLQNTIIIAGNFLFAGIHSCEHQQNTALQAMPDLSDTLAKSYASLVRSFPPPNIGYIHIVLSN